MIMTHDLESQTTTRELFTVLQRSSVRDLSLLSADRAEAEDSTRTTYNTAIESAELEYKRAREEIENLYQNETQKNNADYQNKKQVIETQYQTDSSNANSERAAVLRKISDKADEKTEQLKKAWQEEVWLTESIYEASENEPKKWYERIYEELKEKLGKLEKIATESVEVVVRYKQEPPVVEEQSAVSASAETMSGKHVSDGTLASATAAFDEVTSESEDYLSQLKKLFVPRLFDSVMLPVGVLFLVVGSGAFTIWITGWKLTDWKTNYWPWIAVGGTIVLVSIGIYFLYKTAKTQVAEVFIPLAANIKNGRDLYQECVKFAGLERDKQKADLITARNSGLQEAKDKYQPRILLVKEQRKQLVAQKTAYYRDIIEDIETHYKTDLNKLQADYDVKSEQIQRDYDDGLSKSQSRYNKKISEANHTHDHNWQTLEKKWKDGMTRAHAIISHSLREDVRLFPDWVDPSWEGWEPPTQFVPAIRFGHIHIDKAKIEHGIPEDKRLSIAGPTAFDIPALLSFPEDCSLLVQSGAEGREESLKLLRTVMLRLLTTLPPGKVRFTILDPVGLGQNFAGFMHLADYEEALVGSRIWTETRHIEQRLADLTEHMEIVIQKYLRNEFETIEEYNVQAGEIAEPYRFLVIADFPVNFNESAASRLASIINSGARCGVYALIFRDQRHSMPKGVQLADMESGTVNLTYNIDQKRFIWNDEDYSEFPLTLDASPDDAFLTKALHKVGEGATDASRVEVPFEIVAPANPGQYWSLTSTAGIKVSMGKAGATKLQYLDLGHGTSQHALIAGKTGSGKSTLFHVLITNLALWYSPDEIQLYLVDFKKGVEFKTYATHNLPHAQAVAIESDREFGLSVLRRLDSEMKRRGTKFRELGVQGIPGYRMACADKPMPRIMLIIDEFQEFFIEDDKLSQDAALLLDRLVRQGRAFGIHVILGSQTLGGAYSLARSTMGQMAVRIALQCGEADSYLILNDDNSAARLLSRPGEALYNAASGAIEGNCPFQVAWLPDERREVHLKPIDNLVIKRGYKRAEPMIVFEGNVPGDVSKNTQLEQLLTAPASSITDMPMSAKMWLGEAIAIKEPTNALFKRQSGSNLIIVGQREDPALAMMSSALISLAAQYPVNTANSDNPVHTGNKTLEFYILDSITEDDPYKGLLARVATIIPHTTHMVEWRNITESLTTIVNEIERRQELHETNAASIFVLVHGLHRFRMLRRKDDDFSFSSYSDDSGNNGGGDAKPERPDKLFDRILKDGPPFGVHAVMWCDTVTSMTRMLDRNALHEIELRALFQMSATDSSHLIDSPEGGRLGLRRALYYCEELGKLEKFRPYGIPTDEWLEKVRSWFSYKTTTNI